MTATRGIATSGMIATIMTAIRGIATSGMIATIEAFQIYKIV
jgi:hypothetical protein